MVRRSEALVLGDAGRQAVHNGLEAKAYTRDRLVRLGYGLLRRLPEASQQPFFLMDWRSPYLTPYGTPLVPDFYVWHGEKHPHGLIIEHKYQDKAGSADHKLHFTVASLKATGKPVMLVMTGVGFSEGARWYCQQAQDRRFTVVESLDAWAALLNRGLL